MSCTAKSDPPSAFVVDLAEKLYVLMMSRVRVPGVDTSSPICAWENQPQQLRDDWIAVAEYKTRAEQCRS